MDLNEKQRLDDLKQALVLLTRLMIGDEQNPEGKLGYLEHDLVNPTLGVTVDNCEQSCLKCYSVDIYDTLMDIDEFKQIIKDIL